MLWTLLDHPLYAIAYAQSSLRMDAARDSPTYQGGAVWELSTYQDCGLGIVYIPRLWFGNCLLTKAVVWELSTY